MKQNTISNLLILLLTALFISHFAFGAESPRKTVKKGIEHYTNEEYDKALAEFLAGMEADPDKRELKYDLGTALYKLDDIEKAIGAFAQATDEDKPKLAADAWYNLGNAMFKSGDLEKAVQSYKNSLYLDHNDEDAKHNLELALLMQQMQQQQQQQQSQDSDSTQQQQQQQQQEKEQEQEQQQAAEEQQSEQQSEQQEEQQQPQPKKETEMSREEALQLLQALENDEQEAQKEKLERQFGQPKRVEKDW